MEPVVEPTAAQLWDEVSGRLRETLNETTYATWFGATDAGELLDDSFSIVVPNDFTREWIEGHFLGFLRAATADVLGRDVRVLLRVDEPVPPVAELRGIPEPARTEGDGLATSPKYTFDLFVIGSSNRFAHAAALAVSEAPAQAYNPLFIYGGTGLGKTHLLQAIGQYVTEHSRGLTTRYVTSETFMNDFINSLRD
ncbi:MAG TPA: DnaA/Hda family protein, partial [Gaiellaceae bacterium]|nr:DnaA/Hda family protein [Gaiellaceae bacterium]